MRIHRVQVNPKEGSAYIYFEPPITGASVRQVNIADSLILDFGKDGRIIGLEVPHPEFTAMLMDQRTLEQFESAQVPVSVG